MGPIIWNTISNTTVRNMPEQVWALITAYIIGMVSFWVMAKFK